jgi:hypothetical protein
MDKSTKTRKSSVSRQIREICRACTPFNISRIKYENIEIEFRNGSEAVKFISKDSNGYVKNPTADMPPDDVMLFAATGEYEAMLQSRKNK